jgi:hypothetical protein
MTLIHLYATAEASSTVLCGTNTVGAAIQIAKLSLFTPEEICRDCLAKSRSLRDGDRREK